MTPTTPPALLRFREPHRIVLSREWDEDMGRFTPVCGHDAIRVYTLRDGSYRHDPSEVKQLAAFERGWKLGDPVDWR